MALKSYIITHDVKSPYVVATGLPHNPQAIKLKLFRKGQVVKGELKHANNKPAFVLVNGVCVVNLDCIKELVTKEIKSGGDGSTTTQSPVNVLNNTIGSSKNNSNPKIRYIDAMILGSLVGFGGVFLAEKKGWISEPDNKYRMYGALAGAALGFYIVYRQKTQSRKLKITSNE